MILRFACWVVFGEAWALRCLLLMPAGHHQKEFSLPRVTVSSVVVFSAVKNIWEVGEALLGAWCVPEGSLELVEDRLMCASLP